MDKDDFIPILIVFVVFTGIFVGAITQTVYVNDIKELGSSICEVEFGMDYQSYSTKEGLVCKELKETTHYDGTKVTVIGGNKK